MKILITGGSGFLGIHLARYLTEHNVPHISTVRSEASNNQFATGDLLQFNRWSELYQDVFTVIHTAAKAHDMSKHASLKEVYFKTNLDLTVTLAQQAKRHGVRKFIFISTIKVNGGFTNNRPFTADDRPAPTDDYGISKRQAEVELLKLHEPGVFDVVVIRPCLIYGSGVKANFANLIKLVKKRLPLPFGLIKNKRSFVSIDNLVDLIYLCANSNAANGQIFLVSDGKDLTLTELLKAIGHAFQLKPVLLPVPAWCLRCLLWSLGKSEMSQRLLSNLQVDISKTKQILSWTPRYSMEDSLKRMLSSDTTNQQ